MTDIVFVDTKFLIYAHDRDANNRRPLKSYNPFTIAFHQVMPIIRDLRGARSLHEIAFYLFDPPGWKPDGRGTTTEDLRRAQLGAGAEEIETLRSVSSSITD